MVDLAQVSILNSEVRAILSHDGRKYSVSVAFPYSYNSGSNQEYPTIYILDAHLFFGMVTDITRVMAMCGSFAESIVVGIGYPMESNVSHDQAFNQIQARRAKDLTPIIDSEFEKELEDELKVKHVELGGAQDFLTFISKKLVPSIESDYRVDSGRRVLVGHSLGGLFASYALFRQPRLFSGYVICSPSLWYGNNAMFNIEDYFSRHHRQLPVNLYMGIGELEEKTSSPMVSNLYRFAASIMSRNYKGLSFTRQVIGNCSHCSTPAPTFQAGLQTVLK